MIDLIFDWNEVIKYPYFVIRWRLGSHHVLLDSYGFDSDCLHVGAELFWNLFEDLLGQITFSQCIRKCYELDNVAFGKSTIGLQAATISVKFLHASETFVTDSNDNDGAGKLRHWYDQLFGCGHVMNLAISQEEQDLILAHRHLWLNIGSEVFEQGCE